MVGTSKLEVELDGQDLEQVKERVSLGSTVTDTATSERQLTMWIAEATTALSRLKTIWRFRSLKMKTKLILSMFSRHFALFICTLG